MAGGLVGGNSGTITVSYATGNVSGDYAGGLVGGNSGTITASYATGNVSMSRSSEVRAETGGLVGQNYGTITATATPPATCQGSLRADW